MIGEKINKTTKITVNFVQIHLIMLYSASNQGMYLLTILEIIALMIMNIFGEQEMIEANRESQFGIFHGWIRTQILVG